MFGNSSGVFKILFCLRMLSLTIFSLILTSCTSNESSPLSTASTRWIEINDRNHQPLYRAKVPLGWNRQSPLSTDSLSDTTKAIEEFTTAEGNLRIVIHNFPSDMLEDRIPPQAQINRWKQQFSFLNVEDVVVAPQARGGFSGLFFSASGVREGRPYSILAWSMQLAPEHYRQLCCRQMRADYTIKAMGSPILIDKHREEIEAFASSFELIQEIPTPQ